MKAITPEELTAVLEKHKKWLNGEDGGERAALHGANLIGADLSGADLREAYLRGADLHGANLSGADLSGADLREAYLRGADLHGANLIGADLSVANLRWANLSGVNLSGVNLSGANLSEAYLGRADLRWANLHGANLSGANLDYSCWPLCCGSLKVKIDDRIARQLLYHLLRCCAVSEISDELRAALSAPGLIAQANMFHRAEECGKIPAPASTKKG